MVARAAVLRRHLPLVLSVLCLLACWMVPLSAQTAPAPVIALFDAFEWIIIYLVCPVAATYLVVTALMGASEGHHGAGGTAAVKLVCAVAFISITVVMNWLHF